MAYDVGQITLYGNQVHWEIPNFLDLPQNVDSEINSPYFFHKDINLFLGIVPNGRKFDSTEGWLEIHLNSDDCPYLVFHVRVGITDGQGNELHYSWLKWNMETYCYEDKAFLSQYEMESQGSRILEHGHLRVNCTLIEYTVGEAFRQKIEEHALKNLSQSFKELYLGGKDCDVTIRVKDREFRAHRLILKTRTHFFDALLCPNMLEASGGVITVDDCDPGIFECVLLFLYTGRVESPSGGTVCGLYRAAVKYDLPELRDMCVRILKRSLSRDTFCDIICLASSHREVKLLEQAIRFYERHTQDVLIQLFVMEKPEKANEVFKVLKIDYTKT